MVNYFMTETYVTTFISNLFCFTKFIFWSGQTDLKLVGRKEGHAGMNAEIGSYVDCSFDCDLFYIKPKALNS